MTIYFLGDGYHVQRGESGRTLCNREISDRLKPAATDQIAPYSFCPKCRYWEMREQADAAGERAIVYYDPELGTYDWTTYEATKTGGSAAWVNPLWCAYDTAVPDDEAGILWKTAETLVTHFRLQQKGDEQ